MPIAVLLPADSIRSSGVDSAHVTRLAELDTPLPPILVDRRTMQVIDGMHRLLATLLKGESTIEVEIFDGKPEDAFLRAVEANATHGLPLSPADRRGAAVKIVESHPHMSDRAIALAVGLGPKAIAGIRSRATEATQQLNARVGRDGRIRPINSNQGRQRAVEILTEQPNATLREVARLAGVSPATVSDVRKRLAAGESAILNPSPRLPGEEHQQPDVPDLGPQDRLVPEGPERRIRPTAIDPAVALEKLLRDPSLRQKEEGRNLLRLLRQNAVGSSEREDLVAAVPTHCGSMIVDLARQYASMWQEFAQELDERVRLRQAGVAGS